MNNKKPIMILLTLVFVIGGALVFYKYFGSRVDENKIKNNIINNSGIEVLEIKDEVKKAYDFTVYNENGEAVRLSDFNGKKNIVVNFWASWCPPCKLEMPYFNEATEKYKNEDVEILMVNLTDGMRETKEKAKKYIESEGYNLNVLYDLEEEAAFAYRIRGVPRTIFIDKEGNIVYDHLGLITKDDLNRNIEELLKN